MRKTPNTAVPARLARSARPCTSTTDVGCAALCSRLGLRPLRGGTVHSQSSAVGAAGGATVQHAEKKQLPHGLARKTLVRGYYTITIRDVSRFRFLITLARKIDVGLHKGDVLRGDAGISGKEVESVTA